jgi:small GTP-binding protein
MWDTAGQEKFQHIISSYYRGAHGILLVFDITNIKSFIDMQHWVNEAENYSPSNTVKILVGNKLDMKHERSVTYEEAAEYAEKLGVTYIETSAKDDINIEESFTHLIIHMKKQLPPKKCSLIRESQKKITCC